jgi:hypothetical protein
LVLSGELARDHVLRSDAIVVDIESPNGATIVFFPSFIHQRIRQTYKFFHHGSDNMVITPI